MPAAIRRAIDRCSIDDALLLFSTCCFAGAALISVSLYVAVVNGGAQ